MSSRISHGQNMNENEPSTADALLARRILLGQKRHCKKEKRKRNKKEEAPLGFLRLLKIAFFKHLPPEIEGSQSPFTPLIIHFTSIEGNRFKWDESRFRSPPSEPSGSISCRSTRRHTFSTFFVQTFELKPYFCLFNPSFSSVRFTSVRHKLTTLSPCRFPISNFSFG